MSIKLSDVLEKEALKGILDLFGRCWEGLDLQNKLESLKQPEIPEEVLIWISQNEKDREILNVVQKRLQLS
jgi:hypothetical protein